MSRFDNIFRKDETSEFQNSKNSEVQNLESSVVLVDEPPPARKPLGRPPGKKSDPSYRQVTVYLPADLHERGREMAFRSRGKRDFSEIVTEALEAYFGQGEDSDA